MTGPSKLQERFLETFFQDGRGKTMTRLIFLALLIAILKTPGAFARAGDGSLPLMLPGDGSLPLKLSGEASSGANHLATKITLTSATQDALEGGAADALSCHMSGANVSKHAATGTVLIGLAQYSVKGICYNHDTEVMEVVAARGGNERSFLAGGLTNPEPQAFSGNLTVMGSSTAGNYSFSLQSVNDH